MSADLPAHETAAPTPFLDFAGKQILITGASSGIGRETAVLLSRLHAKLVLVGRDAARLEQTRAALAGDGHRVSAFDLSDTDGIPVWFKSLAVETGPFHGLVHSAGTHAILPTRFIDLGHIEGIMRINVYAALMLARCFSQKNHYERPASLVLLSSTAGLVGKQCGAAYSASKAALVGMARSLALEFAPLGIRVNCVAPAMVESAMTAGIREQLTDEQFRSLEAMHPLGLGTTRDAANSIAFLLGSASGWMTGSTLTVDGGYTAA